MSRMQQLCSIPFLVAGVEHDAISDVAGVLCDVYFPHVWRMCYEYLVNVAGLV